ncbi:MAG: N-acetyltransferase [Anaerolineaceae bacterium]|nr:N-acetyltransferase [Anaerolineaceae bacterium]
MKVTPPVPVSVDKMSIDVSEIEGLLQAPPMDLPKWQDASFLLKDGRTIYIREMRDDDIPQLLDFMKLVMEEEKDFYDIVGARVYSEILGVKRKRLKDPFTLLGLIDGEFVGFANGRFMNKDIALSLHTMAFSRRGRVGWAMYYAKTYYALEVCKAQQWWSTFESYNGWRMAGLAMAQPTLPWPEYQHELGGAKIYYVNQDSWNASLKHWLPNYIGNDMNFNVTDEVLKANEVMRMPELDL